MITYRPSETLIAEMVDFRRRLHRHPETGFEVGATAAGIAERLTAAGLAVTTGIGKHGLVATLQRGSGSRVVGLRADMDALPIQEAGEPNHRSVEPGKFHGCGHDGHSAMLLGAALHLAEHPDFDGTAHFIFQPDEENGRGALAMLEDGLLEHFPLDAVYGLHNLPGLPLGSFATRTDEMTAFEEIFEIHIQGRGGHASAPERTVDPLVVGAEILLALQTIVARALTPGDHGVVSATEFVTDGARNVIPSVVTIRGDVRGYKDAVSTVIRRRMHEIVQGVAAAHGATATLRYTREFEPVVNTVAEVDRVAAAVGGIADADIDAHCGRFGFSEDFAQFLCHCPGCYVVMGNGTEGAYASSLHNPHYDFNDAALPFGVEYWVRLVQEELSS